MSITYEVRVTNLYREWHLNGRLHRVGGPAGEYSNGCEWYQNGRLHREDGPAIEFNDGKQEWYFEGKLHRTNGPAIECHGYQEYWIHGVRYKNAEEHRKALTAKIIDIEGKKYHLIEV